MSGSQSTSASRLRSWKSNLASPLLAEAVGGGPGRTGGAVLLAIPAQNLNIALLVALTFAVAASASLPAILYNMFWRRFNPRGATWSIYGGLISSLGLVFFSPVMSGKVDKITGANLSLMPSSIDISWFPLENPGIVSIPLGFLFGYLGTITSPVVVRRSPLIPRGAPLIDQREVGPSLCRCSPLGSSCDRDHSQHRCPRQSLAGDAPLCAPRGSCRGGQCQSRGL